MERILVIRLSAMGDVAMTVPVMKQLLEQHGNVRVDVLTRPAFHAFFPQDERINFIELDLKEKHKGFLGLIRLFRQLKKNNYAAVADLHDVLRSQVIRTLFRMTATPMAYIDKGRKSKKELIRKEDKVYRQLTTTHQRYASVFSKLGYPIKLLHRNLVAKNNNKIGIAPFAAHQEKMWPIERTKRLIERLIENTSAEILLFGGGQNETRVLNEIAKQSPRIVSTADQSLDEQLVAMSELSVLLSMDSANMHLASNLNITVISIWGATHPYAGFLGYNQLASNCIQRDDLDCRPCSVFGNKTCWRGDWACLDIEVDQVYEQLKRFLAEKS